MIVHKNRNDRVHKISGESMVYEGVNQLTAGFTGDAKDLFRRMRPDSGHEGGILTVIKGNFDDGQSDPNNVKSQATGSYSAWVMKAKQTTYRNKKSNEHSHRFPKCMETCPLPFKMHGISRPSTWVRSDEH